MFLCFPISTLAQVLSCLSSVPAICLSRGSQLRCYQTTSCLWLFSSSLTTFEVLKQPLIGGIREPETTVKTKVVAVVIVLTSLPWGKGAVGFDLVKGVRGISVLIANYYSILK